MLVITYCVNEYLIPASKFLRMFCNSHVTKCFLFKMLFGSRIFFKTFLGKEFRNGTVRRHRFGDEIWNVFSFGMSPKCKFRTAVVKRAGAVSV